MVDSGEIDGTTMVIASGLSEWLPFRQFVTLYGLEDELTTELSPTRCAHPAPITVLYSMALLVALLILCS